MNKDVRKLLDGQQQGRKSKKSRNSYPYEYGTMTVCDRLYFVKKTLYSIVSLLFGMRLTSSFCLVGRRFPVCLLAISSDPPGSQSFLAFLL